MTFDPTTNRVSFGLLDQHERIALAKWPHGLKWYSITSERWFETDAPLGMMSALVYRGKPAPTEDV